MEDGQPEGFGSVKGVGAWWLLPVYETSKDFLGLELDEELAVVYIYERTAIGITRLSSLL